MSSVPLITKQGRELLGQTILSARKAKGWSIDDLIEKISMTTGHKLSKGTISSLERGNQKPDWDTLAILASAGFIVDPATGQSYSTSDLFRIASEQINPDSGNSGKNFKSKAFSRTQESETPQPSVLCFV